MTKPGHVEDYFAGLLHGVEKEAFERHLAKCPRCQEALKELRRLDAKLREELPRTIPEEELPSDWVKRKDVYVSMKRPL